MPEIKERPILFSAPMVRAILDGRKTVTRRVVKGLKTDNPREAWAGIRIVQAPDQAWVVYRERDNRTDYGEPWKPRIHMFRRDSRILLEINEVRYERLQDISEEKAQGEGLRAWRATGDGGYSDDGESACDQFIDLWRDINGAGAWAANPWVWVVEFTRVTP